MKKILFVLAGFAAFAGAQTFSWTGAPATITSGTPFPLTLQATAPSTGWSGVGWAASVSGGTITGVTIASGLSAAGEFLTCNSSFGVCLVVGGSLSAIDSTVPNITTAQAIVTLTITPFANSVTVTLGNVGMVNAAGGAIATTAPASLTLPNRCAVTGDGIPSESDFATQLSWSLGLSSPPSGIPAARVATDTTLPYLRSAEIVAAAVVTGACNATQ
jgi:hypothetical protein